MSDIFANLRSGIQFPEVVMNQGPLPGTGGLPRPLHDTADGRINYNSALLGNLNPYAYGEPGYLSSQTAYLNIPHKIQKIVPEVFLPEAKAGTTDFFGLSHPVDDGDLAFALRLDRNSLFCTGLRNGGTRRVGTGTAIDPLINLPTVNYILSGMQLGMRDPGDLWSELIYNLDKRRFGDGNGNIRDFSRNAIVFDDIVHVVKQCIRPFGVARGSEKQGGQNEVGTSPATWPVCFVMSITLDGKESNVMNMWHHIGFSAGEDLVLCLKLMPLRQYTLNHYYKGVKRQNWALPGEQYVWQLVPNVMSLEAPSPKEVDAMRSRIGKLVAGPRLWQAHWYQRDGARGGYGTPMRMPFDVPWQDLGYWHIGRTQIMSGSYGLEEYWHNDSANDLRTNHLDITLQPCFVRVPRAKPSRLMAGETIYPGLGADRGHTGIGKREEEEDRAKKRVTTESHWRPSLTLEKLSGGGERWDAPARTGMPPVDATFTWQWQTERERPVVAAAAPLDDDEPWDAGLGLPATDSGPTPGEEASVTTAEEEAIGLLEEAPPLVRAVPPPASTVASAGVTGKAGVGGKGRGKKGGGSLLRADGSSESGVPVGML